MEDGSQAPIVIADAAEDQPLEGLHGHPHGPVLPAQQIAVEGEAGPVRLDDLQRQEPRPQGFVVLGEVAAPVGG